MQWLHEDKGDFRYNASTCWGFVRCGSALSRQLLLCGCYGWANSATHSRECPQILSRWCYYHYVCDLWRIVKSLATEIWSSHHVGPCVCFNLQLVIVCRGAVRKSSKLFLSLFWNERPSLCAGVWDTIEGGKRLRAHFVVSVLNWRLQMLLYLKHLVALGKRYANSSPNDYPQLCELEWLNLCFILVPRWNSWVGISSKEMLLVTLASHADDGF